MMNNIGPEEEKQLNNLNELLLQDPNDINILMQKGLIYFKCFADDQAVMIFNQILKLDPKNMDAYFWLLESLFYHIADIWKAEKIALYALTLDSNWAYGHKILALMYIEFNNQEKFFYHIRKVIELEPTWLGARISLIEYLVDHENYIEADVEIKKAMLYIDDNFPIPIDEKDLYFESVITWRATPLESRAALMRYQKKVDIGLAK